MPPICDIAHNKQCWPHADPLTALGADITAHDFIKGNSLRLLVKHTNGLRMLEWRYAAVIILVNPKINKKPTL